MDGNMNTIHHRLLCAAVSALLLSGAFAATGLQAAPVQTGTDAQQTASSGPCVFSTHDIDRDGALSKEEYHRLIEHIENRQKTTGRPMRRFLPPLRFEQIDGNDDGMITEDEMIIALNARLHKHRRYRYRGGQL